MTVISDRYRGTSSVTLSTNSSPNVADDVTLIIRPLFELLNSRVLMRGGVKVVLVGYFNDGPTRVSVFGGVISVLGVNVY